MVAASMSTGATCIAIGWVVLVAIVAPILIYYALAAADRRAARRGDGR